MMLNSSNRYKKLILALVCGAVSYSAMGKVYSWRDADGAMHYSQFPRQIVEKNAAQSRASRKQADLDDVVSELSELDNSNLLDGLDDIIANANTLREQDKVLKRRDPQLLLIETQLAKQLAQKQSRQAAQETAAAAVASLSAETNEIKTVKKRLAKNSFMAGVHKRVYGQTKQNSEPEIQQTAAVTAVSNSPQDVEPANIAPARSTNRFLAGIKNKLNRHKTQPAQLDEPVSIVSQPRPVNEFVQEDIQNKFLAEINRKLLRARLGTGAIQPVATSDDVGSNSNVGSNKSLIKSADKIKAIENEIGISNKSNSLKPVTTRQDDSTLMLSRLNNNHTGRLPLNVAGSDLLDRQGIDASSQFAREINRNAEK
jgi:hypothetical protein